MQNIEPINRVKILGNNMKQVKKAPLSKVSSMPQIIKTDDIIQKQTVAKKPAPKLNSNLTSQV